MKKKKSKLNLRKFRVGLIVLAVLGLLFYFRNLFVVAWVNGRPIWRVTFTNELVKAGGTQTLDLMITRDLILQEAKKQKVAIGDSAIQEELKKIEEFATQQGSTLDQLLQIQGMSRQELTKSIRLNKLVETMAGTESAKVQDWLSKLQTAAKIVKWLK